MPGIGMINKEAALRGAPLPWREKDYRCLPWSGWDWCKDQKGL